jgi:hypothetical protein
MTCSPNPTSSCRRLRATLRLYRSAALRRLPLPGSVAMRAAIRFEGAPVDPFTGESGGRDVASPQADPLPG